METLDLDNTLCELLSLEMDTEKVVRKFQDSIVAASKKSFKVSQPTQKKRWVSSQYHGGWENYHEKEI